MRGDFTRSTFDPGKRYSGVRLQQGRVQLDADWNEQVDIDAHLRETGVGDLVGQSGAPRNGGGFRITPTGDGKDLTVSAGRIYVDGILCELAAPASYLQQPDLSAPAAAAVGVHFVYLDVWRHHVTALEDPQIRETALGGPDTATRTRTVCQVKLLRVGESGEAESLHCLSDPEPWLRLTAPREARMRARAEAADPSDEPCVVPAEAGYTRLENQLYRVEIHRGGGIGEATFKWSRENGSPATGWAAQSGNELTVDSAGRDRVLGFSEGDWVELTDDGRELRGEPGLLVQVTGVAGNVLTIEPGGQAIARADFPLHPKVRRWDGSGLRTVEVPAANGGWIELEDGIEIRFEGAGFQTGDHWLIPARAFIGENAGTIEWPRQGEDWLPKPPDGIAHHYCKLAVVRFTDGAFRDVLDCRPQFPALTELMHCLPAGGDGQEAPPGTELPCSLTVGVTNGRWPVEGARVLFEVNPGHGSVFIEDDRLSSVVAVTSTDGIAACRWQLPERFDGDETACLQVTARLVDVAGRAVGTPLFFHARFLLTGEAREEEGIRVEDVLLADEPLENDGRVPIGRLARGLRIVCDAPLAPEPFARIDGASRLTPAKPTCFVTLDLPYPLDGAETEALGATGGFIGFQPTILAATLEVRENEIVWLPHPNVATWLAGNFPALMERRDLSPLLGHLTLKGNFIWHRDRPDVFLDGNAFGRAEERRVGLSFPSGDRRRGGDFEMWFWLDPREPARPGIRIEARGTGTQIAGTLRDAAGGTLPGVVVTLTATNVRQTARTALNGTFGFDGLAAATYTLGAQGPDGSSATARVTLRRTVPPVGGPGGVVLGQGGRRPARPTPAPVRPESVEQEPETGERKGKAKGRKPKGPKGPKG